MHVRNALLLVCCAAATAAFVIRTGPLGPTLTALQFAIAVALALSRSRHDASLTLFFALITASVTMSPWRSWPVIWLLPMLIYGLALVWIPALTTPLRAMRFGAIDRTSAWLTLAVAAASSIVLLLWPEARDVSHLGIDRRGFSEPVIVLILAGIGFAAMNAAIEEVVWRGMLWDLFRRAGLRPRSILIAQALSFGLAHVHGIPHGIVGACLAGAYGLALGVIRHRTKGLGWPILAHTITDMAIFYIMSRFRA